MLGQFALSIFAIGNMIHLMEKSPQITQQNISVIYSSISESKNV